MTPNFSIDLTGQTALVTGASSGLGVRFAQVLAAQGAKVALIGRRQDRLEVVAASIREQGGAALPIVLDMQAPETFDDVLQTVEDTFGAVEILVNNAGIADGMYATRLSLSEMDRVIETNLRGPFAMACRVAERLRAGDRAGRIVNVSSMLAFDYSPNSAAALYSITKSAVVRMTEVLALEWAGFNINVNAIAPGLFESEMTSGMMERVDESSIVKRFPRHRVGKPEHLDSALLFLVSPSSEFVTGTIIKVDDAQSAR